MAIDNWIVTAGITGLVIASFKTPTFYKAYLYEKIFFLGMALSGLIAAFHLGLYVAATSIPDSFDETQKQQLLDSYSSFQIPDKWWFFMLVVFLGNFVLESVSSAVIKHEKNS